MIQITDKDLILEDGLYLVGVSFFEYNSVFINSDFMHIEVIDSSPEDSLTDIINSNLNGTYNWTLTTLVKMQEVK